MTITTLALALLPITLPVTMWSIYKLTAAAIWLMTGDDIDADEEVEEVV